MAILMVILMPKMYPKKLLNSLIVISAILVFSLSLIFLRSQTFISDRQYLQAMIPHHSSAIMTSSNAHIADPEVKKLSEDIIESQEREIRQMKAILKRLDEE
jgi:hypothetical protein